MDGIGRNTSTGTFFDGYPSGNAWIGYMRKQTLTSIILFYNSTWALEFILIDKNPLFAMVVATNIKAQMKVGSIPTISFTSSPESPRPFLAHCQQHCRRRFDMTDLPRNEGRYNGLQYPSFRRLLRFKM